MSGTPVLRCESGRCKAVTNTANLGLLAGDGWRIIPVGDERIAVCPRHNWDERGVLRHPPAEFHRQGSPETAMKPKLLDLFCGAGGAAMGYHRAGFEVVGVDIKPQPRYPFEFHQGDAMTWPLEGFDAIHASPPCQAYSLNLRGLVTQEYPELLAPTRRRLLDQGKPFVIENVVGAPLPSAFILCGMAFGLSMHRHRLFETWPFWCLAPTCFHPPHQTREGRAYSPYDKDSRESWGVGRGKGGAALLMKELMQVDWMHGQEISEAIPPAYTEFIGKLLMETLR